VTEIAANESEVLIFRLHSSRFKANWEGKLELRELLPLALSLECDLFTRERPFIAL
jgi:hypothetical protein